MKLKNRNLVNADSCAFFYTPKTWHPEGPVYTEKAIDNQIRTLAENGIDTYIINPTTQMPWYPSKRRQYVFQGYRRGDREYFRGHGMSQGTTGEKMDPYLDMTVRFANRYLDLQERGIDWFEETERACRRHGVTPWISVRMNDTHGGNMPELSYMNVDLFKNDPTVRRRKPCLYPWDTFERWCWDYQNPKVRDYHLDMIGELIEDYNYEGMELDFLRDPVILTPVASDDDVGMFTDFICEIRRMCDKKATQTGRPFPLGIRAPGHLNLLRDMGLDVRALAGRHIIDFAGFSNFWQTSWDMPHDELRKELGDDITIYGVVEGGPNWVKVKFDDSALREVDVYDNGGDRYMQYEQEMVYANAVSKLVLGADGIEQFNNFYAGDENRFPDLPAFASLRCLDDLEYLRGREKHYLLSCKTRYPDTTMPYETAETLPEILEPESRRVFRIPMCREPLDRDLKMVIQIICQRREVLPKLGVSFNHNWPSFEGTQTDELLFPCSIYTHVRDEHIAFNFEADLKLLREGWNAVTVFNGERTPEGDDEERQKRSVRILSVEVAIKRGG